MKRGLKFFAALFAILLLSSFISAVEFDVKSSYEKDETFIARISGNFFEQPSQGNIIFLKEHTRVSIIPVVRQISGDFYVYAQLLGKSPGNYSIVIEDAKYYQSGVLKESDLGKNFTISETQADFTINPGFVFAKTNFSIDVQNIVDSQIIVSYGIFNTSEFSEESGGFLDSFFESGSDTQKKSQANIKSGEIKKINFNKDDFTPFTIQQIELSTNTTSYLIPVFINANKSKSISESGTETISEEKIKIEFDLSEINVTLPMNSKTTRVVYLSNLGDLDLENLELLFSDSLKDYVSLSKENISGLGKNKSEKIEIIFNSSGMEQTIMGQIKAKTQDDFYAYIDVTLNFVKDFRFSNENDSSIPF